MRTDLEEIFLIDLVETFFWRIYLRKHVQAMESTINICVYVLILSSLEFLVDIHTNIQYKVSFLSGYWISTTPLPWPTFSGKSWVVRFLIDYLTFKCNVFLIKWYFMRFTLFCSLDLVCVLNTTMHPHSPLCLHRSLHSTVTDIWFICLYFTQLWSL